MDADIAFDRAITAIGRLEGPADLDAQGGYVIPGLVDVHFHGCVGEDFSDATPDGLQKSRTLSCPRGSPISAPPA